MSDVPANAESSRFDVRVTAEGHFAWLRTRLAVEGTMMAYLRTAVSLIGFGFAIVQFLHNLPKMQSDTIARFPEAAWYLGLAMIACGVLAAVFSVWEFRRMVQYLWSSGYAAVAGITIEHQPTPLYAVAIVIVLIGIFAFLAVLLHLV